MEPLSTVLKVLIGVALAATVVVLFTGLVSMARGGSFNARWSNKLMRLRVVLQGAAVALLAALMAVMYG